MRLRRLQLQLQQADWFAAAVNLVGVLVGVLLAFQIERWNEARRERRVESGFLERLFDESEANLRNAERFRRQNENTVGELLAINRALDDPPTLSRLEQTPDYGCTMLQLPAARVSNTAYEELAESDRLDILRDERLKGHLRHTLALHGFVTGQLGYFRDSFSYYRTVLGPYHRYVIDPVDGGVDCTMALSDMSRDPAARRMLSTVYRDQRRFLRYRTEEVDALQAEHDHLACLLDKPGCAEPHIEQPQRPPGG